MADISVVPSIGHSRVVAWLKWLLPMLAASLLLVVGAWPQLRSSFDKLGQDVPRIDLREALPFTSGLARHKVEDELRLVEGQPIDAATRKPTVHYRLLETHPDGDHAVNYVYLGSITVEDADHFERRWMVTVRREVEGWRVTNYQELGG